MVYNVVRGADWNAGDAHATALKAIFGVGGYICTNGGAGSTIVKNYGFLALPNGACGSTTHI